MMKCCEDKGDDQRLMLLLPLSDIANEKIDSVNVGCMLRQRSQHVMYNLFIYYINREQSHRTEIQIIRAQTRMANDKHSK